MGMDNNTGVSMMSPGKPNLSRILIMKRLRRVNTFAGTLF